MMVHNGGFQRDKTFASEEATEKKSCLSRTSMRSQKSVEESSPKRPKSEHSGSSGPDLATGKKQGRVRSKTVEGNEFRDRNKQQHATTFDLPGTVSNKTNQKSERENVGLVSPKNAYTISANIKVTNPSAKTDKGTAIQSTLEPMTRSETWEKSAQPLHRKHSEMTSPKKERSKSGKRPSEIPKLKVAVKGNSATAPLRTTHGVQSKLPVKTKESEEGKSCDTKSEASSKSKPESIRMALKSYRVKREAKLDEKIKEAMKDEFGFLVPLYESEFRKITEVWINTLYCSLTMRSNLVKLMHQAFPQLNRSQFQTEDDTLLRYVTHAKNRTKGDSDNLLHFIKALQSNREKLKEQYVLGMANREIAQLYNYDWKYMTRRINELSEETKQLQMEVPELQRKKEQYETTQSNKIKEMETSIHKKDSQLQKVTAQLNALKEKESSYRKNIFLKIQDYKDIRADVCSLKSMEKEYENVKEKFTAENETYEKKIRDLEHLLKEKKKILEKEKEVKQKLLVFLTHLQTMSVGKEEVDYVMGRPHSSKEKRREQLWKAAVKLVLKGFLIQMKKLEKDRNKMLLELQSNDPENFNAVANALVKRDNFIKTIKNQMNDFEKAIEGPNFQLPETPCPVGMQC